MSVISFFDFDGFDDALLVDPLTAIITVAILLAIAIAVVAWPMTTRDTPVERLLRRRHFGYLPPMPSSSILDRPAERSLAESGTGYTARELDQFTRSARRAAPAGQGSGGDGKPSQGAAAAGPYRGRERRAF